MCVCVCVELERRYEARAQIVKRLQGEIERLLEDGNKSAASGWSLLRDVEDQLAQLQPQQQDGKGDEAPTSPVTPSTPFSTASPMLTVSLFLLGGHPHPRSGSFVAVAPTEGSSMPPTAPTSTPVPLSTPPPIDVPVGPRRPRATSQLPSPQRSGSFGLSLLSSSFEVMSPISDAGLFSPSMPSRISMDALDMIQTTPAAGAESYPTPVPQHIRTRSPVMMGGNGARPSAGVPKPSVNDVAAASSDYFADKVTVSDPITVTSGLTSFTLYSCALIKRGKVEIVVHKRYSDFEKLHETLIRLHSSSRAGGSSQVIGMPDMPEKRTIGIVLHATMTTA